MNPLHPSPRLLRRIASHLQHVDDGYVRAWIVAMRSVPRPARSKKFPHTSVVRTFRNQRLCGFEVWRHLDVARKDPMRRKARLWFGCRRHGGQRRALQTAYYAAATISRMTTRELREWWSEYKAARGTGRAVGSLWREEPTVQRLDFDDLARMSHVYQHA